MNDNEKAICHFAGMTQEDCVRALVQQGWPLDKAARAVVMVFADLARKALEK